MHIKSPTVIPAGVKITRIPSTTRKVRSNYSLLKEEERRLGQQAELKQKADRVAQYLKHGYSVREAIKLAEE